MATISAGLSAASTTNASTYTTGSFTPAAADLLVALVLLTGATGNSPTISDTQSIGWTLMGSCLKASSVDTMYFFVANGFSAASSMTVTFGTSGGVTATGIAFSILRIGGMTRAGADAVRQMCQQDNQAAATPAPVFSVAALTTNPCVGSINNATNPATMTQPTGWNEVVDQGYAGPTTGQEIASRASGVTLTTVTWGSASASAFSSFVAELDASARPPDPLNYFIGPDQKNDVVQIIGT